MTVFSLVRPNATIMISIIRPILLAFVTSEPVKRLVVDLLEALAGKTENNLDDAAVAVVRQALIKE